MTTNNPVTDRAREAAAELLDRLGGIQRFEKFGISFAQMDNAFCGAFDRFERDILAGQSVGDAQRIVDAVVGSNADLCTGARAAYQICCAAARKAMLAATPASDSPAIPEDYNGNRPNTYIPPLPKGMKLLAVDAVIGAFAYINHAGTWQGMPNPLPTPASHTAQSDLAETMRVAGPVDYAEWKDSHTAPDFIEFMPSFKTINPKPSNQGVATGTFWYAEGWIAGKRFEFSTQDSRSAAEHLCICLNTALTAALATPAPSRDEVEQNDG